MSQLDSSNNPSYQQAVCARCFEEEDIVDFIAKCGGPPGCSFCAQAYAPTAPLEDVIGHIRECLERFFGFAHDQLPYNSEEGGYSAIIGTLTSYYPTRLNCRCPVIGATIYSPRWLMGLAMRSWCGWDWLTLDYDEDVKTAWRQFCAVIQHARRFFFALDKRREDEAHEPGIHTATELLVELARLFERHGLLKTLPLGTELYRARSCKPQKGYSTARELGPPPAHRAVQANRMNPPGIPMFYAADSEAVAIKETRSQGVVSVGRFRTERDLRILDLTNLPPVPGIFSGAERGERLGLIALHAFACEITQPVDGTDSVHIDYIPSQVVTEFIRGQKFTGGKLDGIRYSSALE